MTSLLKASRPAPTAASLEFQHPHAWICAAVLAVYAQTLAFGVTLLDDNIFIGEKLQHLSRWANAPSLFTQGSFLGSGGQEFFYRPLLMFSFMLDAHLFGGSIRGWHLLNIVFHAISSLLVFSLFRKAGYGKRSFLLALIFAVHPALAQAVGWVPGRTESFLAIFVLASFNFFLDFLAGGRVVRCLLHLFFLGLALLCKELAVVVPAVCCAYAVLMLPGPPPWRRLAAAAAGWLPLLFGWQLLRSTLLASTDAYPSAAVAGSLLENMPALWSYLGKALLPIGLSTYPILADANMALGYASIALLVLALALSKEKSLAALAMGTAWFFAFLLPSFVYPKAHIVPVFFEYRAYLPIVGILMLLAELDSVKRFDPGRRSHAMAAAAMALALGSLAALNCRKYRDGESLWRAAVSGSPHSAFAHKQLGIVFYFQRAFDKAESEYKKALALNPQEPMVHNNLGVLYMNTGRLPEAEEEYLKELSADPDYNHALFNLGVIYYNSGRREKAAELWTKTVNLSPDYLDARRNLAIHYLSKGDQARASEQVAEVIKRGGQVAPELLSLLAKDRLTPPKR